MIALKQRRPQLLIELNGGLDTPEQCLNALDHCDGVMVGRAAYAHPLALGGHRHADLRGAPQTVKASQVLVGLIPHAERHLERGGRLWDLCRHLVQLVEGVPGARHWRRDLGQQAQRKGADLTCWNRLPSS